MTPHSRAASVCSARRMAGISERGTAGSKPPASPSVTMQYVTSMPAAVQPAIVPAGPEVDVVGVGGDDEDRDRPRGRRARCLLSVTPSCGWAERVTGRVSHGRQGLQSPRVEGRADPMRDVMRSEPTRRTPRCSSSPACWWLAVALDAPRTASRLRPPPRFRSPPTSARRSRTTRPTRAGPSATRSTVPVPRRSPDLIRATYGSDESIGIARDACYTTSEHNDGRALDWMNDASSRRRPGQGQGLPRLAAGHGRAAATSSDGPPPRCHVHHLEQADLAGVLAGGLGRLHRYSTRTPTTSTSA